MSFNVSVSSQLNTLFTNGKWFVPEICLLATLLACLTFLSVETITVHQYNKEPIALLAKVKAQTTVAVAQASVLKK
jgi:hypothetical protein